MTWQDQFKIMKRWYYRLQGINGGIENAFSSKDTYQEDFFRAFFISCYQLKDSLKNEVQGVENYIDQNYALQLSGDIANYSKHAKLISTRTGDMNTKALGQMYMYNLSAGPNYLVSLLKIISRNREYNAFEIATACMNAWGNFLIKNSLKIPNIPEEKIYENFPTWHPTRVP